LKSVHALSDRVAWVSGESGLVLHTNDGGLTWLPCVIPQAAEKLNFNGIQGLDENSAVVMSTGKGSLSRIYKTSDGCKTWKLVFTNPDDGGSFKGIRHVTGNQLYLLGDQVDGKIAMFYSSDGGGNWFSTNDPGLEAEKGEAPFSNNGSLISVGPFLMFATKGPASFNLYQTYPNCGSGAQNAGGCPVAWSKTVVDCKSGLYRAFDCRPVPTQYVYWERADNTRSGRSFFDRYWIRCDVKGWGKELEACHYRARSQPTCRGLFLLARPLDNSRA
jgi:photosystem II stability/assembly factor-like uncharacterized protein